MLSGWGRTRLSSCVVLCPRSPRELAEALSGELARRGGVIPRGAGRSYGDAAQNDGGLVLDLTGLRGLQVLPGDPPVLRAMAGSTLSEAAAVLAADGLALPVLPGTRHVTFGGAIAADVHGKNHRVDGSFGRHVREITLCTPDGRLRNLSPQSERELFCATIGGMGLTGAIVSATIAVRHLYAPMLPADVDRTDHIHQALELMADDVRHRYSIAWVDLLSGGRRFGRCTVMRSNDRPAAEALDARGELRWRLPGRRRLAVPKEFPSWVLSDQLVRAFNGLRWHRTRARPTATLVSAGAHFFPLDALGSWNRLYGDGGLLQYQALAPDDRPEVLIEIVQRLRAARLPMYLAVIKRFGEGSGGMLSFPKPGWTIAIDLPAGAPRLHDTLDAIDSWLVSEGGRVYLAKDARLRAELMPAMYPALDAFQRIRAAIDPDRLLRSDLSRRLGLEEVGRR